MVTGRARELSASALLRERRRRGPVAAMAPRPGRGDGATTGRAFFQEMKPLDFRASMRSERPVEGTCWMYWVMPRLSISWKALASSSEM